MIQPFRVSDMLRRPMILAFTCFAFFLGVSAFAQDASAPFAADTFFKTNCVMCHGADGAGSPFGKHIGVPDLRSKAVQSMPTPALAKIISGGKNNMPAFGTRLNNDQILKLVDYIRQFRPAPDSGK